MKRKGNGRMDAPDWLSPAVRKHFGGAPDRAAPVLFAADAAAAAVEELVQRVEHGTPLRVAQIEMLFELSEEDEVTTATLEAVRDAGA